MRPPTLSKHRRTPVSSRSLVKLVGGIGGTLAFASAGLFGMAMRSPLLGGPVVDQAEQEFLHMILHGDSPLSRTLEASEKQELFECLTALKTSGKLRHVIEHYGETLKTFVPILKKYQDTPFSEESILKMSQFIQKQHEHIVEYLASPGEHIDEEKIIMIDAIKSGTFGHYVKQMPDGDEIWKELEGRRHLPQFAQMSYYRNHFEEIRTIRHNELRRHADRILKFKNYIPNFCENDLSKFPKLFLNTLQQIDTVEGIPARLERMRTRQLYLYFMSTLENKLSISPQGFLTHTPLQITTFKDNDLTNIRMRFTTLPHIPIQGPKHSFMTTFITREGAMVREGRNILRSPYDVEITWTQEEFDDEDLLAIDILPDIFLRRNPLMPNGDEWDIRQIWGGMPRVPQGNVLDIPY